MSSTDVSEGIVVFISFNLFDEKACIGIGVYWFGRRFV
jgi:hypothetical protein